MYKRFILFIIFFFVFNNSYSYNLSDNSFQGNNLYYEKTYTIANLKFVVQAPLKTKDNWNKHYESCEEASLFLAHYNSNNIYFDSSSANSEFEKLNFYEENELWIIKDKRHNKESVLTYLRDISIEKMQKLAMWYYWYTYENSHIISSPSIETLKYLISKDYILIVPSNTKTLWNPNFNQSTDSYHVIDLIWYDKLNFISFDPWTSKWAYYKYDYSKVITWIRNNWDKILILEWKRNQKNIDFSNIDNQKQLSQKIDKILSKVDIILTKSPKQGEIILKKILTKIDSEISNLKNDDAKKMLSLLSQKLVTKLDELSFKKDNLSDIN